MRYLAIDIRICWTISSIIKLFIILLFVISSNFAMAEEKTQVISVLRGNGEFTKNLYSILARGEGNIFFSPISIHAILAMASQGSGGKTKEAFIKTLNVPDLKVAADGYKYILQGLNSVKDVTLLMANKIFIKENYKLQTAFQSIVTNSFFSEVQSVDFEKSTAAAKTINDWVEGKTNNKIKDLISGEDIDSDTRLVLVNAIYFKGKWAEPFDVQDTKIEKFYLNDSDTIDVHMMHLKKKFYYKDDEKLDAKVLELPYSNEDISMIVILPNKRNGIAELEQKLAETDLTKISENMYRPEVIVSLPRFKIEQTINLGDSLTKLGLGVMFQKDADFTGMLESPELLSVSKVIQKAFIEVNEEGAEAAAATGMDFIFRCAPKSPEVFMANCPFLIYLVLKEPEHEGNACMQYHILFYGKVMEPLRTDRKRDEL